MPVELRKRKAPAAAAPAPPAKKQSKVTKAATKVKEAVTGKPAKAAAAEPKANGAAKASSNKKVAVGSAIDLTNFGGEVTTNDGTKTTLKSLVDESGAGVVLFTYPKASTPGCTNQACLFRDSYEPLTAGGLAIFGLSTDSPKANTTFKDKQKLPYTLLCDPDASLIAAIGLKKTPKGTQRGVFAVDKSGKVLLAEPGSPAGTVEAVKKLVEAGELSGAAAPAKEEKEKEEEPANGDAAEEAKEEETAEEAAEKVE